VAPVVRPTLANRPIRGRSGDSIDEPVFRSGIGSTAIPSELDGHGVQSASPRQNDFID